MLSKVDRRQYLSEAFHTMSQPLTGLQCGLELAVAIPRDPEEYRRRICEALEITTRLRHLTAALRELVEAEDVGEDAGRVEIGSMFSALREKVLALAELHKASAEIENCRELDAYASESKLSRTLLFLLEEVLAENSALSCRARRVNENIEIIVEDRKATKQKREQQKHWRDQVSAIRMSAAENYIRTLGGELQRSESRCILELPLLSQNRTV